MPSAVAAPAEWELRDGLFREPRLSAAGLRHGMTTRAHGDMTDPARRAALEPVAVLRQEHGVVSREAAQARPVLPGDGLVSRDPALAVGVFTADCVPILLWSDDGLAVGAFHAGWRGLAAGMGRAAVAAMGGAAGLSAAIGPHIGSCCYEVGPELEASFPAGRFARRAGRLFLALGAEARAQLEAGGLPPGRIAASALCTACRPELSSWRRDRARLNMLTFIAPRAA